MISHADVIRAFQDSLANHGIAISDPSRIELDGKWHRAHVEGDRGRDEHLAYRIHFDDRPAGYWKDHKRGAEDTFTCSNGEDLDPQARAAANAIWREAAAQRAAEREASYQEAGQRAQAALTAAQAATAEHPYLARKGIVPGASVRVHDGRILIPVVTEIGGKPSSYQTISADGEKLFMAGGRMAGAFHPITGPNRSRVLVCEGYATGAALHRATGHSVACAMSAGNVPAVVRTMLARFPDREVVICPDNDHGTQARTGSNPGLEAAAGLGCRVVAPVFPADADPKATDWDDWLRGYGTAAELVEMIAGELATDPPGGPRGGGPLETGGGWLSEVSPPGERLDYVHTDAPSATATAEGELVNLPRQHDDAAMSITGIWRQCALECNDKNIPNANFDNATRLMERHPTFAGMFWFDDFLQRVMTAWDGQARELRDADEDHVHLWMQRVAGIARMPKMAAQQAINVVAYANRRNELTEWLDSLKWDGVNRLEQLMSAGFSAERNEYSEAVGRCWVVSMVARAYAPGCKVDTMPVFEGTQGTKKSTALQVLVGERWFTEIHDDIMSKDFFITLQGNLLVEISEMHAFGRAEVERIKGVITCRNDRYRAPYGRVAQDHPRQCVFGGTTNRDDWNRDETGARRFWPIKCLSEIDLGWIATQRSQLFAEAVARYRRGEQWWDVPGEAAEREQDARRAHDVWQDKIYDYLDGRSWATTTDVLERVVGLELSKQSLQEQRRCGSVMRALGWRPIVRREGNRTIRGWERNPASLAKMSQEPLI